MTSPSGTTTLNYDQLGRMTAYGSTAYAYNGDGLRMSKTTGRTTEAFTWQPSGPAGIPTILVDGTTNYVYGPEGLPLEQISGSTVLYYLHDELGSTRELIDSTGTAVATYTYNPYGAVAGSTGTTTNPFRFAGGFTDSESGFLYLRHRYYDASALGEILDSVPRLLPPSKRTAPLRYRERPHAAFPRWAGQGSNLRPWD